MSSHSHQKRRTGFAIFSVSGVLLIALGVALTVGFNSAMEATNTEAFCISCHEMESTVYQEYQHSVHASNPSGVRATCPDCHVPKPWGEKVIRKIQASSEVYHWLVGTIDTAEKFEARRLHLANREWARMKANDSQECRNCHGVDSMALAGQARFAASIHADGLSEGKTCIDCHQGISHQLPVIEQTVEVAAKDVDLEYGEEINETCAGCHGENAEGSASGEYPRLAGMSVPYLVKQLNHFKARERLNIPMVPYTNERELPEEDVQAIAHFLANIQLPTKLAAVDENTLDASFNALGRLQASLAVVNIPRHPGNVQAGRRVWQKECATCHGVQGQGSVDGLTPPLVGQYSAYLLRQIEQFQQGDRVHTHPRDAAIFQQFGLQELHDIMAYLSVQDD